MLTTRKTFTPEFKRKVVRLLEQGDRFSADLAGELGVRRGRLYKLERTAVEWRDQGGGINGIKGSECLKGGKRL